jgi:hypothetical protein
MITAKNRKKAEKLIIDTIAAMDPSGLNSNRYKELFKKMSDKDFIEYFKKMKSSEDNQFYVEMDLYGKNNITLDNIEKAAAHIHIPLEEYVYIRHKTTDGKVIRTPYKVPVLWVHMKRMQQLLSKKVKSNVDISSGNVRSRLTGSLNQDNKSGRFTDYDTQALLSVTLDDPNKEDSNGYSPIIKEVLGARGDNIEAKNKFLQDISLFGNASIEEVDTAKSGQAVQTLDVFLMAAGLKSDLVSHSLLINK